MTTNRLPLHTLLLAIGVAIFTFYVGGSVVQRQQKVRQEEDELNVRKQICTLVEAAPYATWFCTTDLKHCWYNSAYKNEFGSGDQQQILRQLMVSGPKVVAGAATTSGIVQVDTNNRQSDYYVTLYPIVDEGGNPGIGGIAIREARLRSQYMQYIRDNKVQLLPMPAGQRLVQD